MPVGLVGIGGVLVAVTGIAFFAFLRTKKPVEPPHFR